MSLPRDHSRCRACGCVIRWAKSENGRPIPLDIAPAADGNIVIRPGPIAHVLKKDEEPTAATFKSHFATCPERDRFKKPRPAEAAGGRA